MIGTSLFAFGVPDILDYLYTKNREKAFIINFFFHTGTQNCQYPSVFSAYCLILLIAKVCLHFSVFILTLPNALLVINLVLYALVCKLYNSIIHIYFYFHLFCILVDYNFYSMYVCVTYLYTKS